MSALRRFRHPVPIRVHVKQGKPSSVSIMERGLSGGTIDSCAGPWRTSGSWWDTRISNPESRVSRSDEDPESRIPIPNPESRIPSPESRGSRVPNPESRVPNPGSRLPDPWDRDEWDVALADGPTYRLFRERHSDKWFLEGVVDLQSSGR